MQSLPAGMACSEELVLLSSASSNSTKCCQRCKNGFFACMRTAEQHSTETGRAPLWRTGCHFTLCVTQLIPSTAEGHDALER